MLTHSCGNSGWQNCCFFISQALCIQATKMKFCVQNIINCAWNNCALCGWGSGLWWQLCGQCVAKSSTNMQSQYTCILPIDGSNDDRALKLIEVVWLGQACLSLMLGLAQPLQVRLPHTNTTKANRPSMAAFNSTCLSIPAGRNKYDLQANIRQWLRTLVSAD